MAKKRKYKKRKPTKPKKTRRSSAKKRGRKKKQPQLEINPKVLTSIAALLFYLLTFLTVLSFFADGQAINAIQRIITALFGWGKIFVPITFFFAGNILIKPSAKISRPTLLLGTIIICLSLIALTKSGQVGQTAWESLFFLMSGIGAFLIYLAGVLIGIMVFFEITLKDIFSFKNFVTIKKPEEKAEDKKQLKLEDQKEVKEEKPKKKLGLFAKKDKKEKQSDDPKFKINNQIEEQEPEWDDEPLIRPQTQILPKNDSFDSDKGFLNTSQIVEWTPPPLSLLNLPQKTKTDNSDLSKNADIIEETLRNFGVEASIEEVSPGPSVTQYAIKPKVGTKLTKITSLSNDLAMSLAARTGQIRIEAPIPGKPLVGIEVPNSDLTTVTLRQILKNPEMKKQKSKLAVGLGLDVAGRQQILDIAKMPHLLIAGQTGSGKSVCINAILSSILFRTAPHEVKLILVDPKRVELSVYDGIPHLLTPVIVEPEKVLSSLKWAVAEMDKRYKILAQEGCRNIEAYNEKMGSIVMPYIVIVIDELADIMLFAPSEVEDCINRLAQMARAVGLHLVLATQRPSVDVITGLIKANIPARIAFSVSSMMDSRVILDSPGAEKLLGRGDMLFIPPDQAKPRRLQGAFVSDPEIKNLTDFLRNNGVNTSYSKDIIEKYQGAETKGGRPIEQKGFGDVDELFEESVRTICQYNKASASLLQRALSIGYNRAARILDQLHEAGAISAPNGSKPREVMISDPNVFLAELSEKNSK